MTAKKFNIPEDKKTSNGESAFYGSVLKFNLQEPIEDKQQRLPLSCYFDVKNHIELLNIGRKFHASFEKGNKVFALLGFNKVKDVEEMTLGLGAYFNYDHGTPCQLITPDFKNATFNKYVKEEMTKEVEKWDNCYLEYNKTYSLSQFSIMGLENIYKTVDLVKFEEILSDIFSKKDYAYFVALPDLETIESNLEFYYPILQHIDSVAIFTEFKKTKEQELTKNMNYFEKSNIKIEGIILK